MLIFSSKCVHHVLFVVIILQITIIQVESAFSAAKVRRTQSVRLPSYNSELIPKTRPASTSSITSTASHKVEFESKSASTSSFQPEIDQHQHHHHQETALKPLLEGESNSKHVRFMGSASLIDPNAGTQSENIDPTRDGVFARVRNRMLRYGSGAVIGSAIGAGGLAAKQLLFQNNNNTTRPMNSTQNLSNQTDYEDISNPF